MCNSKPSESYWNLLGTSMSKAGSPMWSTKALHGGRNKIVTLETIPFSPVDSKIYSRQALVSTMQPEFWFDQLPKSKSLKLLIFLELYSLRYLSSFCIPNKTMKTYVPKMFSKINLQLFGSCPILYCWYLPFAL